jgi:hypothetical protein
LSAKKMNSKGRAKNSLRRADFAFSGLVIQVVAAVAFVDALLFLEYSGSRARNTLVKLGSVAILTREVAAGARSI